MTISQELDVFLAKHNRRAKEETTVSLGAACVLWPACFIGIAILVGRGMLAGWAWVAVVYVLANLIATVVLILSRQGCDPVADSSLLDGAQDRSLFTRLPVFELATLWQLLCLPGRMTADIVLRWRDRVAFSQEERQAAETLLGRLKQAEGLPVPWRESMAPAPVLARLVRIGAVRMEEDYYGRPVVSRRLVLGEEEYLDGLAEVKKTGDR